MNNLFQDFKNLEMNIKHNDFRETIKKFLVYGNQSANLLIIRNNIYYNIILLM